MATAEISEKKEDKTEKVIEISIEDYLKKEFPILKDIEYQVDFHLLWGDKKSKCYYRINFWAKKEKDKGRTAPWFKSSKINRSLFVEVMKDGLNWKYKIV